MKIQARKVFVILLATLAVVCFWNQRTDVDASSVTRSLNNQANLKIKIKNQEIDRHLGELVYTIKNTSKERIKVTKVILQKKTENEWQNLEEKEDALLARNIKVKSQTKQYDSINIKKNFVIGKKGLEKGKYRLYIVYKYNGRKCCATKKFCIGDCKSYIDEEPKAPAGAPPSMEENTEITATVPKTFQENNMWAVLFNNDFGIRENGDAYAIVFSEAHYKRTYKVKINIAIQKKKKSKWRTYRKYKVKKKSNIAYINKTFKIKHHGTYRMVVKVKFYRTDRKTKTYKVFGKKIRY